MEEGSKISVSAPLWGVRPPLELGFGKLPVVWGCKAPEAPNSQSQLLGKNTTLWTCERLRCLTAGTYQLPLVLRNSTYQSTFRQTSGKTL